VDQCAGPLDRHVAPVVGRGRVLLACRWRLHCLYAHGPRAIRPDSDSFAGGLRVLRAFTVKMLICRRRVCRLGLPGSARRLHALIVIWLTSAYWFFQTFVSSTERRPDYVRRNHSACGIGLRRRAVRSRCGRCARYDSTAATRRAEQPAVLAGRRPAGPRPGGSGSPTQAPAAAPTLARPLTSRSAPAGARQSANCPSPNRSRARSRRSRPCARIKVARRGRQWRTINCPCHAASSISPTARSRTPGQEPPRTDRHRGQRNSIVLA